MNQSAAGLGLHGVPSVGTIRANRPEPSRAESNESRRGPLAKASLYIGNLPYSANEEHIVSHFAAFEPDNVRIVEGRGFAFVDIPLEKLEAAIEQMNGSEMMGRRLNVSEARPREPRPRDGGGFRGPGGPPQGGGGYGRGPGGGDYGDRDSGRTWHDGGGFERGGSDRGGYDRGGRSGGRPGRGRRGDGREPRW